MLKAAICDDNKIMLDFLSREIDAVMSEHEIEHEISCFTVGQAFLDSHAESPYDVVFLDIKMPDMDGFEVAGKIRNIFDRTYIIFITTESALVYDSFDFQPFHFIPKASPEITKERIRNVIDKLMIHISANKKIKIPMPYGLSEFVNPTDILFLKSSGNYVEYHLKNKEILKVRKKLDEVSHDLSPHLFIRLHKSYFVNMDFIEKINFPKLQAFLRDGNVISISKARKKEVEELYIEYLRNFRR